VIDEATLAKAVGHAATDGEFGLRASGWTGRLLLMVGDDAWALPIVSGAVGAPQRTRELVVGSDDVLLGGRDDLWRSMLAAVPPPGFTDPWAASMHGLRFEATGLSATRHGAIRRFVELLRHAVNGTDPAPRPQAKRHRHGEHDRTVGRYIHLDLDGIDHRVYYEEAGEGVALLCQHTAGSDARQWRHLLEDERVTSRFRVIAYDLPFHGKSVPPESVAWWAQDYKLTTASAMLVPNTLAEALALDRPVFIGSSIGGMLALDLARYHPDRYRAVIAVQGGLKVASASDRPPEPGFAAASAATDPAGHAELMMMVMGPGAPEAFRHETRFHYAQGAPGVFRGDINYYAGTHDLTEEADRIDTTRCPVYLLTGTYDFRTVDVSREAAARIRGATLQLMNGLGHFPMSEDPERFSSYLLPVLDRIAGS